MKHIALLLPELEAGGAQRVILLLAREFVTRGHCVDLVILRATGSLQSEIPDGVNLVNLAAREYGFGQLGFTCTSVVRLTMWLKRARPEVLLSTITGANLVALLARKMLYSSPKIIIREAATLKNARTTLFTKAMSWLYPQADAVIALSHIMAEELTAELGVSPSKIHLISNPVDVDFIQAQAQLPLDHSWLNDTRLKIIVSVGRLVPQKDYTTLLRAFALLPSSLPIRLIIIGEGSEHKSLEHLAVELSISKKVEFVGFDKNPWRWMARADLFVLSSLWEGYPNVLLEALALNLPVISTEYDASVHDLAAHYHFSVVPAADPESLALALDSLLQNGCQPNKYKPIHIKTKIVDNYLEVLAR